MKNISKTSKNKIADPVYLIVPGFIGNYSEGFVKRLYDFLLQNDQNVRGVLFRGHEAIELELASLDEMVVQLISEYNQLRREYPKNSIVVLAHSQGCAVALKAALSFDENTSFVFFAPAIFLDRIILTRITPEDRRLIELNQERKCKISKEKCRIINRKWIQSYQNFSLVKELPNVQQKCLIIRPKDDWIEKEDTDFLIEKLPNRTYLELLGDHTFSEPKDAFDILVKKVFLW